ncbi:MAG: hypothetical protein ACI9YT_001319 [Halobacteriales archaeon]|jgi:hypothetical protein
MTPEDSPQQRSTSPLDDLVDEGETSPNDDLGRRMGRDARRVSRGELSEREFYEKYHDEVVEQFGFDRRPGGETE